MTQLSGLQKFAATLIDSIPGVYQPQDDLETTTAALALDTVMIASGSLIVLTILALLFSNRVPKLKLPLFILMALVMAGSTLTLIVSTVNLNIKSDSGGPVHWHADTEVWACGNELELRDPTGFLSNKIGTSTLHEHDDHRVHLEGVVVDEVIDASLGKYFHVIGGAITDSNMVVPLNDDDNIYEDEEDGDGPSGDNAAALASHIVDDPELGKIATFQDGQMCGDQVADVQAFVYNFNDDDKTYKQRKLSGDEVRDYVIANDPNVPPGDCLIFEFGPTREQTDKLCEQYGVRDTDRCEAFGVLPNQRAICEIKQVDYDPLKTIPTQAAEQIQETNDADSEATEENTSGDPDTTSELVPAPVEVTPPVEEGEL